MPLIIAIGGKLRSGEDAFRTSFSGDNHRSMGTSPIVAEIPSFLSARAASKQKLANYFA